MPKVCDPRAVMIEMLEEGGFKGRPSEYLAWLKLSNPNWSDDEIRQAFGVYLAKDEVAQKALIGMLLDEICQTPVVS